MAYVVIYNPDPKTIEVPIVSNDKDECIQYLMDNVDPYHSEYYRIICTEKSEDNSINDEDSIESRKFSDLDFNIVFSFSVVGHFDRDIYNSISDVFDIYVQNPSYTKLEAGTKVLECDITGYNLRNKEPSGIRGYIVIGKNDYIKYVKNTIGTKSYTRFTAANSLYNDIMRLVRNFAVDNFTNNVRDTIYVAGGNMYKMIDSIIL